MSHVVNGLVYVWATPDPTAPTAANPNAINDPVDPDRNSWPYRQFSTGEIQKSIDEIKRKGVPNDQNRYRDPDGPWYFVVYESISDLILKIDQILSTETWIGDDQKTHDHPCLRVLEIASHGNPDRCGGLTSKTVGAFATQFDYLTLSDDVDIYLSGCLTGCRNWADPTNKIPSEGEDIAELLADLLPGPKHRPNYRVTVWGTKGTLNGHHAAGTARTGAFEIEFRPDGSWYVEDYACQKHADPNPGSPTDPAYYGFRGPYSQ